MNERDGWFDADAHVIEPPWIWTEYTPRALHDRVPRLEMRGGATWLVCDGEDLFPIGRLGGLARGERGLRLTADALTGSWDESIVPGAYDARARIEAMAVDGVAQALLYPTVAMTFFSLRDAALRRELLRAYNRWVSDLCAQQPDALLSVCIVDPDDLDGTRQEIERAAQRKQSGVLVPLWADGSSDYGAATFDPLWTTATLFGLPVGFHAFTSRERHNVRAGMDLAVDAVVTRPASVVAAFTRLIFGGVFERIPDLRWFSAENDAGWCGYFVERADVLFERSAGHVDIKRPPSEQFREHVFVTFSAERAAVANAALIGVDNLLWGSDYPHNVTTWPRSREVVGAMFDEFAVRPEAQRKLTRNNARRLFMR